MSSVRFSNTLSTGASIGSHFKAMTRIVLALEVCAISLNALLRGVYCLHMNDVHVAKIVSLIEFVHCVLVMVMKVRETCSVPLHDFFTE